MGKKHDPHICCLQETHLSTKGLHRLEKLLQANRQEKKAWLAIDISDKTDFKTRAIKRDTEGHFIILKGRIHQEDINIVNIYAPKCIRKILEDFKKDIESNTLILGNFNTLLPTMDRSSEQRISKDIVTLNDATDKWT